MSALALPNRRFVWLVLIVVTIAAILFFFVFPTRDYFNQRAERSERRAELAEVRDEVEALESRVEALQSDAEIERLAREEYHLVYPDEEAYTVLPPPVSPTSVP